MPRARKLGEIWVYSKQGGVQLSREDFNKLCNKEPVFIKDMESQKPKQQADTSGAQKVEATDQKGRSTMRGYGLTKTGERFAIPASTPIR